jgi:tight adherence protein C
MPELLSGTGWLLPAGVFGAVLFGAWALMSILADRQARPLERVKRLTPGAAAANPLESTLVRRNDRVQELLELAAPALSKPLMPKNEYEQSQLKLRLATAGWRSEGAVSTYLALKFVLTVIGLGTGLFSYSSSHGFQLLDMKFWCVVGVSACIGFYLPDIVLGYRRKKRKDAIFYTLPDALDLMVVCVEAGLGLDAAMRRVGQEIRRNAPILSQELELANLQLQMGRQRREVLHDLGVRNGVDDLRSLVAILIQADRFGSSIGQALRVQSDSMRTRRRQLAEERAQKTAVKLIFPLVLFIFPGIFVVLVGPAGITISRNLGAAMGGG